MMKTDHGLLSVGLPLRESPKDQAARNTAGRGMGNSRAIWILHGIFLPLTVMSILFWYSSFLFAVNQLTHALLPGYGWMAAIGSWKAMAIFRYLAIFDNSTVSALLFPMVIGSIYRGFFLLLSGRLNQINRFPSNKYYQTVAYQDRNSPNGPLKRKLLPVSFPFYHSYKVTTLQLGLIGTLYAMTVAFQQTAFLRANPETGGLTTVVEGVQGKGVSESEQPVTGKPVAEAELPPDASGPLRQTLPDIPERYDSLKISNAGDDDQIKMATGRGSELKLKIQNSADGSHILLSALGTALWSSLMAILLAFIVGPHLIERASVAIVKRWFLAQIEYAALPDPQEIGKKFDEMGIKVDESRIRFARLATTLGEAGVNPLQEKKGGLVENLALVNQRVGEILEKVSTGLQVHDLGQAIAGILKAYGEETVSLRTAVAELRQEVGALKSIEEGNLEKIREVGKRVEALKSEMRRETQAEIGGIAKALQGALEKYPRS